MPELTARAVRAALQAEASEAERIKITKRMTDDVTAVIGVRMGRLFEIAKEHADLPLDEVDELLLDDAYEARMAGVSILDFQARRRGVDRAALYELWMRRIDRLNTWDYIDRSAPRVVGLFLRHEPRDILFDLARSSNLWHRRTAITATFAIIRAGDIDDALALCELLAADPERFVQTSVGTALREIGRVDPTRLAGFLDRRGNDLIAEARRTARTGLG